MARCSKFPDMGIDGVNFDPEKEICGGRKISEEQRYIISWVKKISRVACDPSSLIKV